MGILSGGIVREAPPKDGVWKGGKWLGAPSEYTMWGWQRDLSEVPRFEPSELVGITPAQVMAGLSVNSNRLRWSSRDAVNSGANSAHSLRLFLPYGFRLFHAEGVQFSMNMWAGSVTGAVNGTYCRCGMETVDKDGNAHIVPGATSSRFCEGYETSSNQARRSFQYLEEPKNVTYGSAINGMQLSIFPQKVRQSGNTNNLIPPMGAYMSTNSTSNYYIEDIRPPGIDSGDYYWRPFIEINANLLSAAIQAEFFISDFTISGIPEL